MSKLISYRSYIFFTLALTVFVAFTISYAVTNIAMFLCLGLFLLDTKKQLHKKWQKIKSDKLILVYGLFFIIQGIGLGYSDNIDEGIRRVEVMLPLLILPPILLTEKLPFNLYKHLITSVKIVIPLTFLVLLCIHLFIDHKAFSTYVHFTIQEKIGVSQFYLAFILLIPILDAIKQIRLKKELIFNLITGVLSLLMLVLLGNKTTLFFLVIIAVNEVFVLFTKNYKSAILLIIIVGALGYLTYQVPIVNNRLNVVLKTTDFDYKTIKTKNKFTQTKNTLEHRLYIDYISLDLIKQKWLFGYGTGDVQDHLRASYKESNFKVAYLGNYNPHNQYLNEFLKTGVFGGILFITLIVLLLKQPQNPISFKIILFFSLACFIESYLVRQHGVVILAFIIPFFIQNEKIYT